MDLGITWLFLSFFFKPLGVCWGAGGRFLAWSLLALPFCVCVQAELQAKVEQGLAEGLFVCDLERRRRECKIGRGRAHVGMRPQEVSSFKLKGRGAPLV